ncbi:hypothetical protein [Isoalcanivorax indicus]|uniref:hypothetical protein n=1 Tax=Isoalcanivorax indicus TaxID=2202653 RepID=UPI000DB95A8A|nr:hypothetical protein [Isoalcanivorax indicus]
MRNRQRGAYSFLFLVVLIAGGLLVFALAADGARLYAQQRILQQQADAIALAAARGVQTCGGDSASSGQVCLLAQQHAVQSGFPVSVDCENVQTGVLSTAGSDLYTFSPAPFLQSNSVRVVLNETAPRSLLLPGRIVGQTTLTAQSTARRQLVGTFSSSPDTLALGLEEASLLNGLLSEVLGMPVGLGLVDYQDLRDATAGLGDLLVELAQLGVGDTTLETLLGSDVPADVLILALRGAVGALTPAGQVLDGLLAGGGLGLVSISNVLEIVDAASVPESSRLPVYDLLISTILNLAEGALIELPIDVSLPGVASVTANILTDAAPVVAVGVARQDADGGWVTSARGADIHVELLAMIELDLTILGTGVRATVSLPLTTSTGSARGDFVSAACADGFSNLVQVGVGARTAVADVEGAADVLVQLSLIGIPVTITGLRLVVDLPVGAQEEELTYPWMDLHSQQQETIRAGQPLNLSGLGSGSVRIEGSANPSASCGLLCSTFNALLSPIIALLNVTLFNALLPVVGGLLDVVVGPLLTALGLELGTASITVSDLQQAQPVIVRTVE